MTVVQNVESNLGYVMQTHLAVHAIPLLVSIFDRFRELFARSKVGRGNSAAAEESKEGEIPIIQTSGPPTASGDLLDSITTLNIEGADPASFSEFESVHPLPSGDY